jgi:hypothetical protein
MNFGANKLKSPEKMNVFYDVMKKYDVIFVEEITDKAGTVQRQL